MRFSPWKRTVALGLLAGLVSVVVGCGDDAGEGAPYRIGVMESLTGTGETYGTVAYRAKIMAMDEINAAGGIDGRRLELVVEDSKCSAQDAISAYNKLTDVDGVKIILGTSCSGAMLGVAPLAEADGVVLFSGLASNPDIADAGDYIFRTQISDIEVGIRTGNVLWADGIRTLATITEETDYAEGVRRTSVAQFEQNGGRVIAEERFASDTTDFRSQLTKLFNASPDALHVAPQSEFAAGTIVKQARELGYQGPIYGETITVGRTALDIADDAATGLKAITATADPDNAKRRRKFSPASGNATTTSLCPGTSGPLTTPSTSRRSASSRPTTIRTPTDFGTASTTSPGAALSATTTASTPTARSSVSPGPSWRFFRRASKRKKTTVTRSWAGMRRGSVPREHVAPIGRPGVRPPSRPGTPSSKTASVAIEAL